MPHLVPNCALKQACLSSTWPQRAMKQNNGIAFSSSSSLSSCDFQVKANLCCQTDSSCLIPPRFCKIWSGLFLFIPNPIKSKCSINCFEIFSFQKSTNWKIVSVLDFCLKGAQGDNLFCAKLMLSSFDCERSFFFLDFLLSENSTPVLCYCFVKARL